MMSHWLKVLLVVATSIGALCGCGDGAQAGPDTTDTTDVSVADDGASASDAALDGVDEEADVALDLIADTERDSGIDTTGDSEVDTTGDSGVDVTGDSEVDVTGDSEVDVALPAALPPWLAYCEGATCEGPPLVLAVCSSEAPDCEPVRATTIVPSVDGRPISAVAFPLGLPEGAVLRAVSGSGAVNAHLVTSYAARVELRSDLDVTISYYALAPVWGGTVALDFVTTTQTSDPLESVFFRHPSYDTGAAAHDLHATGALAIAAEHDITGITSERVHAFFLPMELAAASGGEGNFSYGDGVVTSNYGNPPYIDALGGIMNVAFPRFAHECAHELFDEIHTSFIGDARCLNEGIADALAWLSGYLPEADFGPIGLRGASFDDGCVGLDEIHDIGNCYLWQVKRAGLLTPGFMRGIFHPEHVFDFDSCNQTLEQTGNALFVYFTEAAGGADLGPVFDAMGVPHAATYAEALVLLGY